MTQINSASYILCHLHSFSDRTQSLPVVYGHSCPKEHYQALCPCMTKRIEQIKYIVWALLVKITSDSVTMIKKFMLVIQWCNLFLLYYIWLSLFAKLKTLPVTLNLMTILDFQLKVELWSNNQAEQLQWVREQTRYAVYFISVSSRLYASQYAFGGKRKSKEKVISVGKVTVFVCLFVVGFFVWFIINL